MSKYEKKGTITFSPTAITDKEEVHELHGKAENAGSGSAASNPFDLILQGINEETQWTYKPTILHGDCDSIRRKKEQDLPVLAVLIVICKQGSNAGNQLNCLATRIFTDDYSDDVTIDFDKPDHTTIRCFIHPDNSIEMTLLD